MSKGDFTPGKTVVVRFNTHKADGTPITLAGTPAISAYKNSTTESNAGVTLTVDYDSRTGLHHVSIDTSADGTFYAAGNDFDLVITTGTVDSISVVGTVVGGFSLSNRSALRPATADRTLVVDAAGLADANMVKAGPTGSGTAQTAGDIYGKISPSTFPSGTLISGGTGSNQLSTSSGQVLLQSGTSTGQLDFTSGVLNQVKLANAAMGGSSLNLTLNNLAVGGTATFTGAVTATNASNDLRGILLQATQTGVTIPTVTTLTNAPSDSSGVTTLLSRVPSGIFTGITSLAQWLGLIAGKQTGNSTARTEIRATGAGSGTFDETTDSVEALRDRGDAAWITATSVTVSDKTGFRLSATGVDDIWDEDISGHQTSGTAGYAANAVLDIYANGWDGVNGVIKANSQYISGVAGQVSIRNAVGLSSANLDTQLTAIDDFIDTEVAAIYSRIGAPAGASIAADIAAIAADSPNTPTKNVAFSNLVFTMVDATDFNTPETGVTVTAQISKDGGSFANCTNSVSEISGGFYKISLTSTEMNCDAVALKFTGTGCAQRNFSFRTQPT